MNHAARKAVRTILQLVVSGGLTAAVTALADLKAEWTPLILAGWQVLVTYAQNELEASGAVPTLLPSPAVPGAKAPLVATTPSGVVGR